MAFLASRYGTNVLGAFDAIRYDKPFLNNMAGPIAESTGISNELAGLLTNIMDTQTSGPADPNFLTLNELVAILDAPYLGSGGYAQPTVFDGLYPPLKYLLANNGDISAVVQGMGIPLPGILNHTNTVSESMPNILSAVGSHNRFNIDYLGVLEACGSYGNALGSVLGLGKAILDAINGLLRIVIGAILGVLSAGIAAIVAVVQAFLDAIKAIIKPLYDLIAKELSYLMGLFAELAKQGLALFLAFVNDPCVRAVVDSLGSPALKDAVRLGNVIDSTDDFIPYIIQNQVI